MINPEARSVVLRRDDGLYIMRSDDEDWREKRKKTHYWRGTTRLGDAQVFDSFDQALDTAKSFGNSCRWTVVLKGDKTDREESI